MKFVIIEDVAVNPDLVGLVRTVGEDSQGFRCEIISEGTSQLFRSTRETVTKLLEGEG